MKTKTTMNDGWPRAFPPVECEVDDLKERVLRLFAVSDDAFLAEAENEARISALTQDFLRAKNVCLSTGMASLFERYRESKIPDSPIDAGEYLEELGEQMVANAINTSSPRYIGHMTSALPHFIRPLSKLLTTLNQNQVKLETSKSLTFCERQALGMLHRLIYGFPGDFYDEHIQHRDSTLGMIVSGGTLANLTALWCAYNSSLGAIDGFAGVDKVGLPEALKVRGSQRAVIIGSALSHYSLEKATSLLGLGSENFIKVPVDRDHRISLSALRKTVADCRERNQLIIALVANVGTTESGAIDPLVEMSEVAAEVGAHFHIDAAWGGALLFSRQHRRRLEGIDLADSVTIDGHKQLYLPMGIGMVLLKHPHLAKAIERNARYIVRANSIDLGKRTLEGSRPAMAMFLHAALHLIGRRGYEFLFNESIRKTQYMADLVRVDPTFELLVEPQMNILNYRAIPEPLQQRAAMGQLSPADNQLINEFNIKLQRLQRQAGRTFVSRTTLDRTRYGQGVSIVSLRSVIANPLTTEADIRAVLDNQLEILAGLNKSSTSTSSAGFREQL